MPAGVFSRASITTDSSSTSAAVSCVTIPSSTPTSKRHLQPQKVQQRTISHGLGLTGAVILAPADQGNDHHRNGRDHRAAVLQ